ncbi:MAG: RNA polymerase factor sigma-54 [Phycisphaerae bacterium]|jgi:RNA polymerase sigma-54 factor
MRLDTSQQMRLEQRMKLAPRIIQSMEILQLPMMALQERIEAEMQSNPVLELRDPDVDDEAPLVKDDEVPDRGERDLVVDADNGQGEDFQRLTEFEDEYGSEFPHSDAPSRPAPAPGERDRKLDAMANTPAPVESLNEYLLQQWSFIEGPDPIKAAGRVIINFIDDDGYLRTPLEEMPKQTNEPVTLENLKAALRVVQLLDPPGVGARDLKECILIQLAAEAAAGRDVSLETELVTHFLRDIEMNRLPQIAKRTGKSVEQIKAAIENLSRLNSRPGLLVGERSAPTITPDVMVEPLPNGELRVTLPDGHQPSLYISKAYRKMIQDRSVDREARSFIQKNIRSAQWLIGAIEQRRATVRRVVEEVFKVQKDFLDEGPEALKPLPMAQVAGKVGVHVATVSRAVSGKYVQTPRGIFPLRMFFSGGTTNAEGQDVAWDAVKAKLQEIVGAEDKANPLNDDELAEELKKNGLDIARRTVAKYRKLLDIAPARKRRKY